MNENKNNNNGNNNGSAVAPAIKNEMQSGEQEEDFMLDLSDKASDRRETPAITPKPKPKRITISIETDVLNDLKILEQIGACRTKEEFIAQAVTDRRNEAMKKLQTAVGKI